MPRGSIVVGVDGSEDADRAVAWAAGQAARERRLLAIVHSTDQLALRDTAWLDAQGIDHGELATALRESARATLATATEQAVAAHQVRVVSALVDDDPRMALVDLSTDAHLVVLGSRGRGPLRSALLGSVSASVARHASCPAVICRPPGKETATTARIVVGVDGSPASAPVLEFAFAQASRQGAPLTVMHCFWDVLVATRGPGVVGVGDPEDLSDLRLMLAESVAGFAEKFPDVEVTQALARGLVDDCLTDQSPDAALLVIGRSPASGLSRFLHSSCALAVLERARTTVAVVPEAP